ncbi:MAG: hypothetical protein RMK29_01480 [Myxococcales bacterium]|nr:hypothetical protein [Myxococcota bacterium]MDW8280350.1 hypothetical protein [Myxococcales bacterium]
MWRLITAVTRGGWSLRGRTLTALVLALSPGALGCNNPSGLLLTEPEVTALPPIKVDLPPPPSFAEPSIPRQYPDGTLSIYGLRKQSDKYLGKSVKVKAYLLEIYQCPVCPKKQTCKPCDQPHFFLSDEPNGKKEKALMVTDYRAQKAKDPKLTIGKQYTVDGTFARHSPTGFSYSEGLLVFDRMIDDTGKEYLGPAAEMQRQAEAGAAAEKAAYEAATKAKR